MKKPSASFSPVLSDNHGRPLDYLRLAVTDRCNLRCYYCMPAEGLNFVPRKELLTYEEMHQLVQLMLTMGVRKVRITGGEPFVRKDLIGFLERLSNLPGLEELHLTTNGVLTGDYIPALKALGITSVNLSIDSLDRERFRTITRRDELERVTNTFHDLLAAEIPVKINVVVMEGQNIDDLIPFAELTRKHPIGVRYLEEMPFNGGSHAVQTPWNHKMILNHLQEHYPELEKMKDGANSTSSNYQIPGYRGSVGIIAAFSRTFCGSCNRIRITPQGHLHTCLYGPGELNLRDLLRAGKSENELKTVLYKAFGNRAINGFEAEKRLSEPSQLSASMATIGG